MKASIFDKIINKIEAFLMMNIKEKKKNGTTIYLGEIRYR